MSNPTEAPLYFWKLFAFYLVVAAICGGAYVRIHGMSDCRADLQRAEAALEYEQAVSDDRVTAACEGCSDPYQCSANLSKAVAAELGILFMDGEPSPEFQDTIDEALHCIEVHEEAGGR